MTGPDPRCPVCLGDPAPTTTCRMCGEEGKPFVVGEEASGWSRPEFQISEAGDLIRAENQHLRTVLRHIADTSEDEFSRELARKAIDP